MVAPEPHVPLSAVGLRLTDEVGHAVLDWVAAGDLSLSAALDQHVAAVRAALAACEPEEPGSARLAGQAAHERARSRVALPHHARRRGAATRLEPDAASGPGAVSSATAETACPDVPFTDSASQPDAAPLPLRLLLHYACGFVEAAVRADWWPGEGEAAAGTADFESVRLAAVCRLIGHTAAAAALPPELR